MGIKLKPRSIAQAKAYMEKYVVYYDRGLIVCNKPTDMTCQMSYSSSVKYMRFNILCKGIQQHLNLLDPPKSVHRLDKNTTGALMLGRNPEWARNLSRQFVHRKVGKEYLALVYAKEGHFTETSGVIENHLSEEKGRVRFDPHRGTPTKTEWELLASSPKLPVSLMRLKLYTGHKHQLRFHLANCLQAPVVGDDTYKCPALKDVVKHSIILPSKLMFLHAHELSLERWTRFGPTPRTMFTQTFRVPVPPKFWALCRDVKMPVEKEFLKTGAMLINGERWTITDHLYHEDEKCWISPRLLPGSHELPDIKDEHH